MPIQGTRKKFWLIVGSVTLLLILFLVFADPFRLWRLVQTIEWVRMVVGIVVLLPGYLLLAVRMRYLLLNRPTWQKGFNGASIGYMLHSVMFVPAMVAKIVSLSWVTSTSVAQTSSAVLVERLIEQIMRLLATILVIALLSAQRTDPNLSIAGSVILLVVAFGAIFWILRHRENVIHWLADKLGHTRFTNEQQVRSTASSLLDGLEIISSTRRLLYMLFISVVMWACFLAFQYLVLSALVPNFAPLQTLLIASVVLMVMPPSINITPIFYQVVVIAVLTIFNLTDLTLAIVYAIALHLIMMLFWLVAGRLSLDQTGLTLRQLLQEVKDQSTKAKAAKA